MPGEEHQWLRAQSNVPAADGSSQECKYWEDVGSGTPLTQEYYLPVIQLVN